MAKERNHGHNKIAGPFFKFHQLPILVPVPASYFNRSRKYLIISPGFKVEDNIACSCNALPKVYKSGTNGSCINPAVRLIK